MDSIFMKRALAVAREHSMNHEGGPFGAVVVKDGKIISEAWNTVTSDNDPTAHAEVNAIRKACKKLNTYDLHDCKIYSTTEPCPMCLSAIYWSHIQALYFGNTRQDAERIGFQDNFLYEEFKKDIKKRRLKTTGGILEQEANNLFDAWSKLENREMY